MIVIGSDYFAKSIAKELNVKFFWMETKTFPDNEVYVRFKQERYINDDVVLVVRGKSPGFDPNKLVVKTIFLVRHLKDMKCRVYLVMPYIPYARQDKVFLEGEIVSIKLLRDLLKENVELIVTVTSHDFRKEGWIDKNVYNIDGTDVIIDFLKKQKYEKPFIIAPDMGSNMFVKKIGKELNANIISLKKHRDRKTGKITTTGKLDDLFGCELIIYDDIISTGRTLFNAIEKGLNANTGEIISIAVHPVLAGDCYRKIRELEEKYDIKFHATNTIESPISNISVVSCISLFLKEFL